MHESRFLDADAKEAKNGLYDARELAKGARDRAISATEDAERTRREQQGLIVRICQLETPRLESFSRTLLRVI